MSRLLTLCSGFPLVSLGTINMALLHWIPNRFAVEQFNAYFAFILHPTAFLQYSRRCCQVSSSPNQSTAPSRRSACYIAIFGVATPSINENPLSSRTSAISRDEISLGTATPASSVCGRLASGNYSTSATHRNPYSLLTVDAPSPKRADSQKCSHHHPWTNHHPATPGKNLRTALVGS